MMSLPSDIQNRFPKLSVRDQVPLREYTTFRLGGPCPLLIDGPDAADLPGLVQMIIRHNHRFLVIGQGANLVVSDRGLEEVVIRFCSNTPRIKLQNGLLTVSGDTLLDDLALYTTRHECGDLTFCTGIPGTVGGGLAGNAGAFGRQIGDHLVSANLLGPDGQTRTVHAAELEFSYRHSRLKQSGEVVLDATFKLPMIDPSALQAERRRILQFRKDHHPDWNREPCAGSVFRNIEPTSAAERRQAAGRFLEEAGAKSLRVGGARLYEKHANIIVADNGCTAQDVWTLSEKMAAAVKLKFGIDLVREVLFLGRFDTPGGGI